MLIKRARIQNFRCLEDVDLPFESVTTFIGPNGVGKSTVLRALDWFFNGGLLTRDDVRHGADPWIRVEVEFSDLTPADRSALGKYAPVSRDTVTIWRTWDDGDDKMTGKALAFPAFEEIRAMAGAVERRRKYAAFRNEHPELDLLQPAAANQDALEDAMSDWERAHPGHLEEADSSATHFFGFAGQGLMSGLFDYVLVSADLRASEETEDSRGSLLSRILERRVDRASAEPELQDVSSRYRDEVDVIYREHFGEQLDTISRELSDALAAFTKGRSVEVSAVNADLRPQKVQFSVSITDQSVSITDQIAKTSVERQGHGLQRALLISALKLLADHGAAGDQQGVICLAIEEPELFQHPVQARAFAVVLRQLADNAQQRIQVTYATHSPFFVEAAYFKQVRRVSRQKDLNGGQEKIRVTHASPGDVIRRLDGYLSISDVERRIETICESLPEAFFAETVILVEGSSDQGVLEGCAEREGGTFLAMDGIEVVNAHGKDSILLPHAILTLLGIPCYLVFDGDKDVPDNMRANNRNKAPAEVESLVRPTADKLRKTNRDILRYFKATEEDWPSTGAYAEYAVYENNLEDELKKHWPDFGTRMTKLIEDGHGFPGKHKATYRRTAAEAPGKAPDVFQQILVAARARRNGQ